MSVATRSDQISNRRLREAFLHEQRMGRLDANIVAIRLGWVHDNKPDVSRVLRTLGLVDESSGGQKPYRRRRVLRSRAVEVCEAMGLDPVDLTDERFKRLPGVL